MDELKKDIENLEIKHHLLKQAVHAVIYESITVGNGGYISQFGPVTFSSLVKNSDYDLKGKGRRINKKLKG
jgi:hypothetical protein